MPKTVRIIVAGGFQQIPVGMWVQCAECLRCYQLGEYQSVLVCEEGELIELQRCPYQDCIGVYPLDAMLWSSVVVPVRGCVYEQTFSQVVELVHFQQHQNA